MTEGYASFWQWYARKDTSIPFDSAGLDPSHTGVLDTLQYLASIKVKKKSELDDTSYDNFHFFHSRLNLLLESLLQSTKTNCPDELVKCIINYQEPTSFDPKEAFVLGLPLLVIRITLNLYKMNTYPEYIPVWEEFTNRYWPAIVK